MCSAFFAASSTPALLPNKDQIREGKSFPAGLGTIELLLNRL
jgi:hypothetical protein